jgi:hypothetical protein
MIVENTHWVKMNTFRRERSFSKKSNKSQQLHLGRKRCLSPNVSSMCDTDCAVVDSNSTSRQYNKVSKQGALRNDKNPTKRSGVEQILTSPLQRAQSGLQEIATSSKNVRPLQVKYQQSASKK